MATDWKSIVATVAPGLATVLGGPLAGAAVGALSSSLLGHPNGGTSDLAQAISSGSPDILAKIIQADKQLQLDMEKLGVDYEKIAADDRASARAMQIANKDYTVPVLAWLYTIAYFAALWAVWKYGLGAAGANQDAGDILKTLIGGLSALQIMIMNYYFGSSNGSAQKNDIINRLSK